MLKLVFYTGDQILKVRSAQASDIFENSYKWNGHLEFILTPKNDFTMTWTSFLPDIEPRYASALVELVGARYPLSSLYPKLSALCPDLLFQNNAKEWVFFAGSFNPWHKGHQTCIQLLPEDKLCLILPDRNPHKEDRDINPVATVLEISSHAKFKKNQFIVPTFLQLQGKNPTINWIKKFKEDFPTYEASLLIGFDSFSSLKTWTNAKELLPLLSSLYVVSRLEDDDARILALDEAHALNSNLNIVFLGRHQFENVSSTQIRNTLRGYRG